MRSMPSKPASPPARSPAHRRCGRWRSSTRWSRSGAGPMPARSATSVGGRPVSTPRSRSAARWCSATESCCRPARGSSPTRTRRASTRRPKRRRPRCCGRSHWRSPDRRFRSQLPGVYFSTVFKLLSTSGDQAIDLAPGRTLVVGRAVTSDVPIYDPTISRRHAEISLGPAGVRVKDLGSSNGTFLNGARITQADATTNDVITFGKVAFKVASITPPARPSTPAPETSQTSGSRGIPQGTIVRQLPVSPSSGGVPAIVHGGTAAAASGGGHLKVAAQTEEERREKKLSLLFEIAKELSRQQEPDQVLNKVVDVTFQIFNVDRVSIL